MGPVRLLRQPFALLLGAAAAPALHPARPAGRLCVDRRQGRRTPSAGGPARRGTRAGGHPARADAAGRQALLRPPVRAGLGRAGRAAAAAGPLAGSRFGSCSASWPWPPRSGTTTRPDNRPYGHWSLRPLTLESII